MASILDRIQARHIDLVTFRKDWDVPGSPRPRFTTPNRGPSHAFVQGERKGLHRRSDGGSSADRSTPTPHRGVSGTLAGASPRRSPLVFVRTGPSGPTSDGLKPWA